MCALRRSAPYNRSTNQSLRALGEGKKEGGGGGEREREREGEGEREEIEREGGRESRTGRSRFSKSED